MGAHYKKDIYPWVLVALLWGVGFLNYLDRQMLSTLQDAIAVDIDALQSATKFGFLMGIFLWVYGLTSPVAGVIADKVNRKWVVIVSLFVFSAVTFGMGMANTYRQLYILRAMMGLSEALYLPAGLSLIADFHRKKTRSLAIGIHMTGLYLGAAIGGFGGTFAAMHSWHATFHTIGIVGMIYAVILFFLLRDTPAHAHPKTTMLQQKKLPLLKAFSVLLTNISFWIILLYFSVPSLPGWATKNWLPTLFSENLGMPMSKAGPLSTMTLAVASFVGVIIGGWVSDRWVQRNIKGRVYTGAIGLLLTLPGLFFLGFGHSLLVLVLAGSCFGIGFGMFDANNMPILCQFVSSRYRATAYGIMNMVGVFAGALITDFLGKATDAGNLGRDFALLAAIVLVAVIVQLRGLNPTVNDFDELGAAKVKA